MSRKHLGFFIRGRKRSSLRGGGEEGEEAMETIGRVSWEEEEEEEDTGGSQVGINGVTVS